jgi:hypothetical protein
MYGIDQQVEQTADAYRGKPQLLQQKYAQNQQLIDLLALQKLKSDKENAARQISLQMGGQGTPPTVAQQRESEVMDMTKQEVVQEQAGVMQNKMRQQQEAQKKLLQAAGAPGIAEPSAGIAGVPAPNIQGMAGGGIVAFNGTTGSAVDGNQGEEEARRAYAARRQEPQREAPRAGSQSGLQAGLATLLALRPEDVYRQRSEEVSGGANYSPEERAQKQRQIDEAARFARESELTNFFLGMAGRSTPALAIAGGGSALQNARNQAMLNRQRAEGELIDVGPAARLAGFKAAGEGERTAMTGLAQGTGDAVRLVQIGESSASRADARITADERMRLQQAESRFDANKKMIFAQMKDLGIEPGSPESVPFFSRINEVGKTIYERMQVPQYFVPEPAPGAPVAPPPKPSRFEGLGNFIQGALGLNPSTAPAARAVDFNQLQRRTQQP